MVRKFGFVFYTGVLLLAVYLFIAGNILMIGGRSEEWVVHAVGFLVAALLAYAIRPRS